MFAIVATRAILRASCKRSLNSKNVIKSPTQQCASNSILTSSRRYYRAHSPFPISRSPMALSGCVQTLLPYHTATSSALLRSKLSASPCGFYWTLEECIDDV